MGRIMESYHLFIKRRNRFSELLPSKLKILVKTVRSQRSYLLAQHATRVYNVVHELRIWGIYFTIRNVAKSTLITVFCDCPYVARCYREPVVVEQNCHGLQVKELTQMQKNIC